MTLNLANGKSGFGVSRLGNGNDENGHPKVNRFYASIPYSFHFGGIWAEKKEVVALPNIVTKINYFVSVDEPGYYLASFFSQIPQDVLNLTNKHLKGVSDEKNELKFWSVSKYFSVTGREECKL